MENVSGTDLRGLLQRRETTFTETQVRFFAFQCIAGLGYMHDSGLFHRDLKPENILIRLDGAVKICDFGFSRAPLTADERADITSVLEVAYRPEGEGDPRVADMKKREYYKNKTRRLSTHVVTRWYRAPEQLLVDYIYGGFQP